MTFPFLKLTDNLFNNYKHKSPENQGLVRLNKVKESYAFSFSITTLPL